MSNHLFIGLGSLGVRSIAALRRLSVKRKVQFKELGVNDPDNKVPKSKFDYLIIDSNIPNEAGLWNSMGQNVSLDDSQILDISSKNLQDLKNLAAQNNIQPWLEGTEFVNDALGGKQAIEGAGQMRRFGRLLGAAKADNITRAIESAVNGFSSGKGGVENSCAFHIFATLVGGTGSGTIVDIVSFIRNRFKGSGGTHNFPIYLYLYIAGEHVQGARKTEYFYLNQYTALRDLNAINVGAYDPDLALLLTNQRESLSKADGLNGINQIIISCDEAGNNTKVDWETQIPHMAEICFNRVYATDAGGLGQGIQDAFSTEDIISNYPAEPSSKHPERSYRFAVACVKRWKIPVEECKKNLFYFTYNQLLNRWLYQNWESNNGYCVRKERSQKQATTLLHLLLQATGNNTSAEAKNNYVNNVEIVFKGILDNYKKKKWTTQGLYELERDFNNVLTYGYAPQAEGQAPLLSLNDFVKTQTQLVDSLCESLREKILEETAKAISQAGLVDMLDSLEETKKGFDNKIAAEKNRIDPEKSRQDELKESLEHRNKEEWSKVTNFAALFNKHHSLLNAHGEDYLNFFKSKLESEMRSVTFALYDAVSQMLGKLVKYAEETVTKFTSQSDKIREYLQKSNTALHELKDDIFVKYEFAYQDLDNIQKEILNNRGYLDSELSSFDPLWKNHAKNMYDAVAQNGVVDNLFVALETNDAEEKSIWKATENLHQWTTDNNPKLKSVLYGSLVDRLKDRYKENPQRLTNEIREFMAAVCSSSAITPTLGLTGTHNTPPLGCMSLGISKDSSFSTKLQKLFEKSKSNNLNILKYVSYSSSDQYEISLMYMQYWMPVRFINAVQYLAEQYHNLDPIKNEKAKYFANIDPTGERDIRPELTYDQGKEQKGFALGAYWQAKLLSCGDPDHTPIVIYRTDSLGQTNIVRNRYIEGHIGTDQKVLNKQKDDTCITEEQYLKNPPMDDVNEINSLVKAALDRIRDMEEPDRFIEAENLRKTAASLVDNTPIDSKERKNAVDGYNHLYDALKKRSLLIIR